MMEKMKTFPSPLQRQILLRCGGVLLGTVLSGAIAILGGIGMPLIPGLLFTLISLLGAWSLYRQCVNHSYVTIEGICTEIERTAIRRRIKTIYLHAQEHDIKLINIRRFRNIYIGATVELYVLERTPVYEADGYKLISNYLALVKK